HIGPPYPRAKVRCRPQRVFFLWGEDSVLLPPAVTSAALHQSSNWLHVARFLTQTLHGYLCRRGAVQGGSSRIHGLLPGGEILQPELCGENADEGRVVAIAGCWLAATFLMEFRNGLAVEKTARVHWMRIEEFAHIGGTVLSDE